MLQQLRLTPVPFVSDTFLAIMWIDLRVGDVRPQPKANAHQRPDAGSYGASRSLLSLLPYAHNDRPVNGPIKVVKPIVLLRTP